MKVQFKSDHYNPFISVNAPTLTYLFDSGILTCTTDYLTPVISFFSLFFTTSLLLEKGFEKFPLKYANLYNCLPQT